MPEDITQHPDAPDLETLAELVIEPVPAEEIERRREAGEHLAEDNLREREDLDYTLTLNRQVRGHDTDQNIGTFLYRYVQLFGTPTFPEYRAGEDISWREDTTFKYLFEVSAPENPELPDEWLMTIFDWRVDLGVAVAEWREDSDASITADEAVAYASIRLAHNIGGEPVQCEFEDTWF